MLPLTSEPHALTPAQEQAIRAQIKKILSPEEAKKILTELLKKHGVTTLPNDLDELKKALNDHNKANVQNTEDPARSCHYQIGTAVDCMNMIEADCDSLGGVWHSDHLCPF